MITALLTSTLTQNIINFVQRPGPSLNETAALPRGTSYSFLNGTVVILGGWYHL